MSAKTERNDEIRAMWERGGTTQNAIGTIYDLSQARVSAIIYRRMPPYHYCVYCQARAERGALCNTCRRVREIGRRKLALKRQKEEAERQAKREKRDCERREARRLQRRKLVASQRHRKTCYICQVTLPSPRKFCDDCINRNNLNIGGRALTRGIVRGRDANTCQVCGYVAKGTEKMRLDVHHLGGLCGKLTKAYDGPEMIHKLITVCHRCHYNLDDHGQNGTKRRDGSYGREESVI